MHRRDVLKTIGGSLAVPVFGHQAAAQSRPYEPLGRVAIPAAKGAVVDPAGETAFVATTDGFVTVDVRTPSDPTILAERQPLLDDHEEGPLRHIWDLKYEADRLVVAGPANPLGRSLSGFLLYDVSNPTRPEQLAFHETDFSIHNCFIRDGLVYLTGNNGQGNPLVIVDITDDTPIEVGRWSLLDHTEAWGNVHWQVRWLHDVWVQDDIAYLAYWDAGTWVLDVSDPSEPAYITTIGGRPVDDLAAVPDEDADSEITELPGNDHYVTVDEESTLLGMGKEAWDDETTDHDGGPAGIELWDISDLSSPQKQATIEPPQDASIEKSMAAYSLGNDDRSAHVGCHECAHRQFDQWLTAHNFDIVGDRLFSSWYEGGVKIHDISDPANPVELAWWRQPADASFWTARRATPSFFVASSMGWNNTDKGALYTFPNRKGEQQDPPSLTAPKTKTDGPINASTELPMAQAATTTEHDKRATAATGGQRGFGILATGLGLTFGVWTSSDGSD